MIDLSSVKTIQTPVLNIGYEDHGESSGFPVMLLHGFPYDVRSFDGVVPLLVEAGYRVLVPYLRGYGPTSFIDTGAPRMAEQAAIGQDVVDFAQALGIDRFALAGFDWGVRAACITSILHKDSWPWAVILSRTLWIKNSLRPHLGKRGCGTSGISTQNRDAPVWKRTAETSSGISGKPGHRPGNTQTKLSTSQRRRSITLISWTSCSTHTGTGT